LQRGISTLKANDTRRRYPMDQPWKESILVKLRDEAGHIEQAEVEMAMQLVSNLESDDDRSWYYSLLAKKLAIARLWEKSMTAAVLANAFYDRFDATVTIASELIRAAQIRRAIPLLEEASTVAHTLNDEKVWPWQRADILNRIAKLFKEIGDFNNADAAWREAVEIAQSGQMHDTDCTSVLREIAQGLALAGHYEFAKEVANSILAPARKEDALRRIETLERRQ
jgi:tetratricopeptide (TPR) repeat protein